MQIVNQKHTDIFIKEISPESTLWVFDFDATITTHGYDSFMPIKEKDTFHEITALNKRMMCIYNTSSYEELEKTLEENTLTLPNEIVAKKELQTFEQFKEEQMNYWREITMKKWVERKLNISEFDHKKFTERTWALSLIKKLLSLQYSVLILSAWVKNVIDHTLIQRWIDYSSPYLTVLGNKFHINEEWTAIGYDNNFITNLNKSSTNYRTLWIPEKKRAIQLWDSHTDAHMVDKHFDREFLLNIWFVISFLFLHFL